MPSEKSLNYYTLVVFAPILILTGISGFVLPNAPVSNVAAYNIFHIVFGLIGVLLVFIKKNSFIRAFNIVFGLIDLYQALASFMNWFPENYFQWKTADDILHIVIGAILVIVGLTGRK